MANQVKNLMIGLFVTAAAGVIIFILMFLHPRIGNEGKLLHVRFTDIDKVNVGTRVTYGGKPVGEVIGIEEVEYGRGGPTDSSGHIYLYELTLRVDTGVNVYNTDEIYLRTSGLLGEKNIEISPVAAGLDQKLVQVDNKVLFAEETGTVEETFKEIKDVAVKIERALDSVTEVIDSVVKNRLVDKVTASIENVHSITTAINKPIDLSQIVTNVNRFTAHANVMVDNLNEAAKNAQTFLGHGQLIFEGVNQGKGTLGKFLNDEDVYLRTSAIMSKLETIMDDVNHYGLLFQSDKGWQRLRARRMNLLQKLRTPQEFRNYFNDEIDQISTSLARVSMVLDKVGCDPYCNNLMQDCEFKKVFSELMRRVSMLEEEVRMYNTQIVEPQVHVTELGCPPLCDQNQ